MTDGVITGGYVTATASGVQRPALGPTTFARLPRAEARNAKAKAEPKAKAKAKAKACAAEPASSEANHGLRCPAGLTGYIGGHEDDDGTQAANQFQGEDGSPKAGTQ